MSKLTKLMKNPVLFFKDAALNRQRRHLATLGRVSDVATEGRTDRIPTYMFGFNSWKHFLTSWFPEREMYFLPIALKADTFEKKWKPRILKDARSEMFIWGFKVEPFVTRFAEQHGIKRYFMEDGFIRSIALGAAHTPPFSLTLDSRTPYFDSNKASDLEVLLNTYDFDADPQLLERARTLMRMLVETGLSKYNHAKPIDIERVYGPKTAKRILVVGQVETDASIIHGCARPYTNNDAVMIAALENPGAQIIYKPHPDVLNKHREMVSNPADVSHLCQVLTQDIPLAQAFETVDHVYTITSQAGFEALMRGIHVTTLGCPFYAGWGLTDDRQANERRTRKLSVEQVFAAAYLLYPKYFDPVYKTPISAEQAVDRLNGLKQLSAPAGGRSLSPQKPGAPSTGSFLENTLATSGPVPTYVIGFGAWKQFISSWFPERTFFFLPPELTAEEFNKKWKTRILKDPRSEILVYGCELKDFIARFADASGIKRYFMADGFIRSIALDPSKAPPLSLVLDAQAPHIDAARPSALETLMATYDFDADSALMEQADRVMHVFLDSGLSKFNHAAPAADLETVYGPKTTKRVLVLGQDENAPSVKYGSIRSYTNNDLVIMAALENPGAQIIFKPHPAVLDKKLKTRSSDLRKVQHLCTVLTQDLPLAQALETVDHVYTNTSQAGFEALLRGIHVTTLGCPFYAGWGLTDDRQEIPRRTRKLTVQQLFAAAYLLYPKYFDPVYKKQISIEQAIPRLLDMKRIEVVPEPAQAPAVVAADVAAAPGRIPTFMFGFNQWKQFLTSWFPDREMHFLPIALKREDFEKKWKPQILQSPGAEFFVWGFKVPEFVTSFARERGIKRYFMEDGFIRSIALGAAHTPPFSLSLDSQTPYFDARQPSDLEDLLNSHDFEADPALMERARKLQDILLNTGLSKYNHAQPVDIEAIYGPKTRKRVLVVGQVEGDASIQFGSARPYTNNDAVMIAALENPDAQIIYKPHPDVLNKHREMVSNPDDVRHLCMVLEQDVPLAQAFETVDHVYTITSQAGFEALLRGIHVTTLGCPFYAGWGLTDDRQPNPRRQRKLTVQQVLAAAYLLYPKYFDPLYKLPITSEQAVERLLALKRMAKPAPTPEAAVEDATVVSEAQAEPTGDEMGVPAAEAATQLLEPALREELSSLRLELANLRFQLSQQALNSEVPQLRENLRQLSHDIGQLRKSVREPELA
ncbi:hypothetical protein [uncultured Azohydromonas sp.]|jgi:Capsule polysaccharide export protein|uniref:capsular polysaccharide export protein, LipB/KpsS family n=1 Tax=uncultured Azohydromonas sp. TaxID=487342 RepID=UPI00260AB461|nr:hypothetical protein [uncultured Azohydromonas sp.]